MHCVAAPCWYPVPLMRWMPLLRPAGPAPGDTGAHSRIMLQADVTETERNRLREAGVQVEPASLQELVIATSTQRKEITV